MTKKFKIYEKILLAMAFCADELIDIWQEGQAAYARRHYFDPWLGPGYKPSNLHQRIYHLLKTGYIEKIIKKGQPYLRLTNQGASKLKRDFPIFTLQNQKWDGKWRLVIFDISEESKYIRNILRDKLKELGFGMLQKSIYISPYDFVADMYEFLRSKKLLGKVFILTAKHELMGEPKDLANYVWKLDKLEDEYLKLWEKISKLAKAKDKSKLIKKIKDKYWDLLKKDPCLPSELLPCDWIGTDVKKAIVKL